MPLYYFHGQTASSTVADFEGADFAGDVEAIHAAESEARELAANSIRSKGAAMAARYVDVADEAGVLVRRVSIIRAALQKLG